jgi:heme oxygenase
MPDVSPPTSAHGSLRAHLKAETAHLHAQIEGVVPLLRPSLDRDGYRAYLARLLGYQGPLEARLAAFGHAWHEHGLHFEGRRKAALLVRDLGALGLTALELGALPECTALPPLCSLDEAWGCLYVLEGSTLGGQFIQRTLGPKLRLSPGDGLAFLGGYGAETGARWNEFTTALDRFDASGCDRGAVLRGACDTFATQMAWLSELDARERGAESW